MSNKFSVGIGILLAVLAIAKVQGQYFQCPAEGYSLDTLCATSAQYCSKPAPVSPMNLADNICFDSSYQRLSEYVSGAPRFDYFYFCDWNQNSQTIYWHIGELAHVARNALPGTKPVYRYWNGQQNMDSTTSQPGLQNIQVDYYVSTERQTGQFALMRFHKGVTNRLALEYNFDILQKKGWTFDETLGYTYRPCPDTFIN